jgi:O-antigen ligase
MSYEISRSDHRVLGTLGNPIVYSVALVLTMPFVFRLKNAFMRIVILSMIFTACLLTQSRTSVIMFAVIILVEMKIWRKSINIFLMILISIVCCVIYISMYDQISFYDINERLIYRDPQNITLRYDMAVWALSNFFWKNDLVGMIFGSGIKSSVNSVYSLGIGQMNTIDNNYVTVLYEYGFVGFALYCSTLILVLQQGWKRKGDFFFPITAYILAGFSFVAIYYLTCNFFWTAIVAGVLYTVKRTEDSASDSHTSLPLS